MAKKPAGKPSRPAPQEDEFEAMANSTKYKKAWKEARKADPGDSGTPTLPDGRYNARVTGAKAGVAGGQNGKPKYLFFSISTVITDGQYKGTRVPHYFSLEPERMDWAVKAVKRLDYEFEDDSASPADMKGIAEDLNETKPLIQISCKNKEVEKIDPTTKKKTKAEVCNWYIDRLIHGETEEPEDEVEEEEEEVEEEEETEDEEETEEEEAEEEEEEETEEEHVFEKGDNVKAKLAGDKRAVEYVILAVNEAKGTAKVKGVVRKNVVADVPLDDLEPIFEE